MIARRYLSPSSGLFFCDGSRWYVDPNGARGQLSTAFSPFLVTDLGPIPVHEILQRYSRQINTVV